MTSSIALPASHPRDPDTDSAPLHTVSLLKHLLESTRYPKSHCLACRVHNSLAMASTNDNTSDDNIDIASEEERCQEMDVEKDGSQAKLERQVSEPPYSVFSKGMKTWIIFLVSISALISPFGASMFLPALNVLSNVLDITPTQVNISITTYMVRLNS